MKFSKHDPFDEDKLKITQWITNAIEEEYQSSGLQHLILPIFNKQKSKKLRPLIVLYTYQMLSHETIDLESLPPLCSAIEICHNASLLVDDVFDKDELRRGEQSFFVKFGTFAALSAAYNLTAFVFDLATRTRNHEVVREIGKVGTALSSALYLSKDLKKSSKIKEEYFLDMVYRKTSALFESSARCGALLATDDEVDIEKIKEFGNLFGTAYQLRDDILAIIGSKRDLGKDPDSDILNRFQSLITIKAMEMTSGKDLELLNQYYFESKDIDPELIRTIIAESGAIVEVIKIAENIRNEAISILESFPKSNSQDKLIKLTSLINFNAVKPLILT